MFKRSLLIVAIALSFSLSHAASASVSAGNSASEQSLPLTIDDILDNAQTIQTEMLNQNRMEALLLVSLSMPEASLKRLAADAKDAGVPLVFRGVPVDPKAPANKPLLNPQSLQAFNFLVELGASVELNPEIFKEFGVTKVPMLIIRKHQQKSPGSSDSCGNQDADAAQNAALVLGDVTLGYMFDTLTDRQDEIGKEAQRLRQKLGERP